MSNEKSDKYEVWAKDEYGRYEIISVLSTKGRPENQWDSPEDAILAARRFAHDKNRNNALTFDEQKRNWTHAVVELEGVADTFYAGDLVGGKRVVLARKGNGRIVGESFPATALERYYLGNTPDEKPWYVTHPRGREINSLDDPIMYGKTILFIHKR